jgi:hypothetical protein
VPELHRLCFALYQVAAAPATIDEVDPGTGWTVLRVAADEALWLGPHAARVDPEVAAAASLLERGAYVDDVVDGWSGLALLGDGRRDLLARLSPLRVREPDAAYRFVQGDVLGIPAKLVALPRAIVVLWPATFDAYVGACTADVGAPLVGAPEIDWAACAPSAPAAAIERTAG